MREKEIEQKLVSAVKMMGGICPKFTSPGFDGMPDRLVLLPNRKFGFPMNLLKSFLQKFFIRCMPYVKLKTNRSPASSLWQHRYV